MHILIVADEAEEIATLKRGLRIKGHSVIEAAGAREAVHVLARNRKGIDMVLTDYFMPDTSGIELLKTVRTNYGQLPVVLITASGRQEQLTDDLRSGCNGFLEKPFSPEQLQTEIERVCSRSGPA